MIELVPHSEGVLLAVRAMPGAKRNEVRGVHDGSLKVGVTQVAEKGKANRALRDLLAQSLRLNRSQVELVSGATTAQKRFLIRGLPLDELRQRLLALLPRDSKPSARDGQA